jgi:Rod binding domain-containing protein
VGDSSFSPVGAGAAGLFDPLTSRTDKLMSQAQVAKGGNGKGEKQEFDESAKDFEALLLTNWLEHAYESFGAVPDSDDDFDLDAGHDQFQAIAMQSLGAAISAAGGIGIAKMIASRLNRVQKAQTEVDQSGGQTPAGRAGEPNSAICPVKTEIPGSICR